MKNDAKHRTGRQQDAFDQKIKFLNAQKVVECDCKKV